MQNRFSKTEDHFYKKSDIILLPIIDLQSTNLTCIYSTLLFIQNQADKLNILTPAITFDQPLMFKASRIKAASLADFIFLWVLLAAFFAATCHFNYSKSARMYL